MHNVRFGNMVKLTSKYTQGLHSLCKRIPVAASIPGLTFAHRVEILIFEFVVQERKLG